MQIKHIKIDDRKCLVDFCLDLDTNTHAGSSTIILGENGTGKSTLLNSIIEIFMSFYSPSIAENIKYNYEVLYSYKNQTITIAKEEDIYSLKINEDLTYYGAIDSYKKTLQGMMMKFIPKSIFYFYDGPHDQTMRIFKRTNANYRRLCTNELIKNWKTNDKFQDIFPQRQFVYCDESLFPAFLISILCGKESYAQRCIKETCHISQIDSIDVEINMQSIKQKICSDQDELEENDVLKYIGFINDIMTESFQRGFLYQSGDCFYFELSGIDKLGMDSLSLFLFFDYLVTMLKTTIHPYVLIGNERIKCDDLSEGQRQLIKILGMLGMCSKKESLVLMDEPDAHMNPKWKYDLKGIIDRCLEEAINTQTIIATHDALVINGVDKRFIRIFTHNKAIKTNNNMYITKVIEPSENTEGLGIDGLLQSEYYGLKTSYDRKTSEKYIKRQELYSKLINGEIKEDEKEELRRLTSELGMLPISYNSIDFLYDDFIKEFRGSDLFSKEYLSYEEIQERRHKIKEIISKLYEEQA